MLRNASKKVLHLFIISAIIFLSLGTTISEATVPTSIDKSIIASKARLSFLMSSVEKINYDVYIVGYNERTIGSKDWIWAHDPYGIIYAGDYFPYITPTTSNQAPALQYLYLFGSERYIADHNNNNTYPNQRISTDGNTYDQIYIAHSNHGEPDILVSTIQAYGGGMTESRCFIIKNGKMQLLRFMNKSQEIRECFYTNIKHIYYLNDGTVAVPWWTNAGEHRGGHLSVYMLDTVNNILIESYTNYIGY